MSKQNKMDSGSSSWIIDDYQSQFLNEQGINDILQNLTKSGIDEMQVELQFKTERNLLKFNQILDQQILEDDLDYERDSYNQRLEKKFRKCRDIEKSKEYDVRQLHFYSFQFLNIFVKFYNVRLEQIETEYHYKLQVNKNILRVFYPKGEKISSFFQNEIFQMKNKLELFFCNDQTVIKKIRYSKYCNQLIQKHQIRAHTNYSYDFANVAIFYSNSHSTKQIKEFVNKNLLQHVTIIFMSDKYLHRRVNQLFFKLSMKFLDEKIQKISFQNGILIETNPEKSCILVHDRHQCFTDAKNQIQNAIKKLMYVGFEGEEGMRTFFNKIAKTKNRQKIYPYLSIKYSRRKVYLVLDSEILCSHPTDQYIKSFLKVFENFFDNVKQTTKVIFYLKNTHYPKITEYVNNFIQGKNIWVQNYELNQNGKETQLTKIVLGLKYLNEFEMIKTKKDFFNIFVKIMLKGQNPENFIKKFNLTISFSAISSQILTQNFSGQNSVEKILQEIDPKDQQVSISQAETFNSEQFEQQTSPNFLHQLQNKKASHNHHRQRKPKYFELPKYQIQPPQIQNQSTKFWDKHLRDKKFEKVLIAKYPQPFEKRGFKLFGITLKSSFKISTNPQNFEKDKFYMSTRISRCTVEGQEQLHHHFIDLNEFQKMEKQTKEKDLFLFFKLKDQNEYLPFYVLKLMQ